MKGYDILITQWVVHWSCYVLFNLIVLELSNWNFSYFQDFDILTYEISKTTEPIEFKFSGIRKGINKLVVLKFQSNPISLRKNF